MSNVALHRADRQVPPEKVHDLLGRHLLIDGYKLVLDTAASNGSWIVDARTGERYLDFYTFFASAPLGLNHPALVDPPFRDLLGQIGASKPANSDIYTTHYAEFVETFARVAGDPALPHLFFVEGGAMAVENALKAAFDWKSRKNEAAGRSPELGTRVLHLRHAFHGRSGYTLSLTNTDPVKTDRFPKFDWPRIPSPAAAFPLDAPSLRKLQEAELEALDQARAAFEAHPHDVACFIAEPIQAEGGDRHLRAEFLHALQRLCHEFEALFVLDEVQTGLATGSAWCYQQLGLEPDIVAFSKKVQVGGIMAGRRIDEVPGNVFAVSGRINSTWGGGLVDMVRSRRILEVIESERLFDTSAARGEQLRAGLEELARAFPGFVTNPRGRGCLCAFDLPDGPTRDHTLNALREAHVLCLGCGERSLRFRPALTIRAEEVDQGLTILGDVIAKVAKEAT